MSHQDLQEKVAYFKQQNLLDLSDDEKEFPDPGFLAAEQLLADARPMPPPPSARRGSSFLGPTPQERQQEFEAHASRQRVVTREHNPSLTRRSAAPEPAPQIFPATKSHTESLQSRKKPTKTASISDITKEGLIPFYRRSGDVPRELKNVKASLALNIKIEPEHKQLLKEKIVYFFPNNDTSMARRLRIHKIIELGAAWVKTWRTNVTHVIFDNGDETFSQLLRHLKIAGLPVSVESM